MSRLSELLFLRADCDIMGRLERNAMKHERIEVNPEVMVGKPVIKGTRLTVESIIQELSGGMSISEILDAHPRLTAEDIQAAQRFAEEYMTLSAAE
jgi:uncharacterized protein (DUF433 family)